MNKDSLEEILKHLAVSMYFNGRTDVTASSDDGVTPGDLGHAEPIMEMKVADTLAAINKTIMEDMLELLPENKVPNYDGGGGMGGGWCLTCEHYKVTCHCVVYNQALEDVRQAIIKKYGKEAPDE